MTQPVEPNKWTWEQVITMVLGEKPPLRTAIDGPAWYRFGGTRRESIERHPWDAPMPSPSNSTQDNTVTLYRRVRDEGPIGGQRQFFIIWGKVAFFDKQGEKSPYESMGEHYTVSSRAIVGLPEGHPMVSPRTFDRAQRTIGNVDRWAADTARSVQTLVDRVRSDSSGLRGATSQALVTALRNVNLDLTDLHEDLNTPSSWARLVGDNAAAIRTFGEAVVDAWSRYTADWEFHPDQLVLTAARQIEQSIDAMDAAMSSRATIAVDAPWPVNFNLGAYRFTLDFTLPESWTALDGWLKFLWRGRMDAMDSVLSYAVEALVRSYTRTANATALGLAPPTPITQTPTPTPNTTPNPNSLTTDTDGPNSHSGGPESLGGGGAGGGLGGLGGGAGGGLDGLGGGAGGGLDGLGGGAGGGVGSLGGGAGGGLDLGSAGGGLDLGSAGGGLDLGSAGGGLDGLGGGAGGGLGSLGGGAGGGLDLGSAGGGLDGLGGAELGGPLPIGGGFPSALGTGGTGKGLSDSDRERIGAGLPPTEDGVIGGRVNVPDSGLTSLSGNPDDPGIVAPAISRQMSGGGGGVSIGALGTSTPSAGGQLGSGGLGGAGGSGSGAQAGTLDGTGVRALSQAGGGGQLDTSGTTGGPMGGGMPFMPMGGMGGMGGGGGGAGAQDKERERKTWLAEEEEVWGTDPDCTPAVIGRDPIPVGNRSERPDAQPSEPGAPRRSTPTRTRRSPKNPGS